MTYKKGSLNYEGKAKKVFEVVGQSDLIYQEFKDSLTALNGEKKGQFADKGVLNRNISSMIFRFLEKNNISTQWVADLEGRVMITKKLSMIPLEVVVRNRAAGSLAKKFRLTEGKILNSPLVEFFYKDDSLGDPFISYDQAIILGFADQNTLTKLKELALKVNASLIELFKKAGLILVDFKLEFGKNSKNEIILADEITGDTCRLWDEKTLAKLDKDRFRLDLGNIDGAYKELYQRVSDALKGVL